MIAELKYKTTLKSAILKVCFCYNTPESKNEVTAGPPKIWLR